MRRFLRQNTKKSQLVKLEKLGCSKRKTSEAPHKSRWVNNLSNKELTTGQHQVLERGLNFALTPKNISRLNLVASAEKGFGNVRNQTEVELARDKITQMILNARVSPPNLCAEERKALKELRLDSNIKIIKADRGNCTVVMNTKDYDDKLLALLNDCEVFRVLFKRDKSITLVEKQVNNLVWSFLKENKITVPVYCRLKYDKSVTPKSYGLPKLHKSGILLRPMVSFIGAPTYQLSKFLANISSPLLTYDFSINNSKHFVQPVNEIQCDDNDFLASFDVKSLFTCILVPDVLRIMENLLLNDAVQAKRTK